MSRFAIAAGMACAMIAHADPYDPPAGYYSSASGLTGAALHTELHNIIDAHTVQSYNNARSILQIIDEDPNDPDRMILIYNNVSLDVSVINPGGSIPGWDSGVTWNREHTWPRSLGVDSSGPDFSDLHALRPCNPSINSSRGNKPFGLPHGGVFWDPDALGGNDRGRIARAMFYMDTRYDGSDANTTDLVVVTGAGGGSTIGDLTDLLEWHFTHPVDTRERRRNDLIHDSYQFNRNPYVDNPEQVWAIWGSGPNNAQLALGTPAADGSSTENTDLGRFIAGATPPSTLVMLDKNGSHPTTFDITATGDADSLDALPRQAFASGVGALAIDVTVADSPAPAALSGTIVVDNTDLTSAGTGLGSDDGNDTINVTADAVTNSEGSFDNLIDDDTLTIDFGTVAASADQSVDIWNLETVAGLTADLEITGVSGSGDTSRLTVDLITPTFVPGASSASFLASFDATGASGPFSATYTFTVSDEPIPGALGGTSLVLTLLGDAGVVCVADVTTTGTSPGDPGYGVADGQITASDLNFYVNLWVAMDLATDVTTTGAGEGDPGYGVPDGQVTSTDLSFFVNAWVTSCAP